jgi:uncharacterized protein (DUF305 family)
MEDVVRSKTIEIIFDRFMKILEQQAVEFDLQDGKFTKADYRRIENLATELYNSRNDEAMQMESESGMSEDDYRNVAMMAANIYIGQTTPEKWGPIKTWGYEW